MMILLWCFIFGNIFFNVFSYDALHDAMTEAEMAFYFQTVDTDLIPEYELVELPMILPVKEAVTSFGDDIEEIEYSFSAFKRPINLKLRRNSGIVSPSFKTYVHDGGNVEPRNYGPRSCHYLHEDDSIVASISICSPKNVQGLIFLDNATLEVHPLTERLRNILRLKEPLLETFIEDITIPHLIKRANLLPNALSGDLFPNAGSVLGEYGGLRPNYNYIVDDVSFPEAVTHTRRANKALTVELALFFDEAAYRIFAPYLNYDDKKIQDMLLAYMNGVQALYHHPSLGRSIDLVIVRLDIMKRQPAAMRHYDGERGKLLDSFCEYQQNLNPPGDSNPEHWDMGLYVSGLDFFAYERGRKSFVTMGLATVGGVCLDKYACIIAEFGTTNIFGKPYPSAGFTSVYILAHEIGHNLGMHHDSSSNTCPKEGFIMSPSRGTNGETQWSTCSAKVVSELGWAKCLEDSSKPATNVDHTRFMGSPGLVYTAKRQCELLLRDKDAIALPNQDQSSICYNLQCKTPNRSGYYFAGPALEGTECGQGKYCYGGDCIKKSRPNPIKEAPGGWGPWKEGTCQSSCIKKSMGYTVKRRLCNNPKPVNTDKGCSGQSSEVGLCDDNKVCKKKRQSVIDYASEKCQEYSKLLPELPAQGAGLQAPHEEGRLWMGCAIFCRRADSPSYYTPRIELNDLGQSPYFPDGTLCHKVGNINYYCLQHHCLPENFKLTKSSEFPDDLAFLQNAGPIYTIPQDVKDYLSLDSHGKPIKTTLDGMKPLNEEDWETDDYIDVPELTHRRSVAMNDEEIMNIL